MPSNMSGAGEERELRDYIRVLRRRKLVVSAATIVVTAAALAASLVQNPVYQATAELLLQPHSQSLFNASATQQGDPTRALDTEIRIVKSRPVADAVRQKLGSAPKFSAVPVGQTDDIQVKAKSADPHRAAAIANAYANSYIDFRRKQNVNSLLAAGQEIEPKISDLQKQIDALDSQITAGGKGAAAQNLAPQRDALVQQQALFKQRLDQLQVDASVNTGGAQLVTPASAPTSPVSPRPARTGAVALAAGLLLGITLAFVFDHLDDSVKTKEDLERVTQGVSTLGLIPLVSTWRAREQPQVVSLGDPNSSVAEAYRSFRTAVQFMGLDHPLHTLQITSPSAAEGKTTTLANLAVALARAGQRVVMVDCDLRRPRIHDFYGVSNEVGFTSVLLGELPLSEAVQEVAGERLLMILASGMLPPNPSELLASQRTVQILGALQSESDVVLIDSPPVLPVTDAAVLSARVDATLLVTRAGTTRQRDLGRAIEVLHQVDAPLVGTVLNGVTDESAYGYTYNYRYYSREREPGRSPIVARDKR
jgi:capsular exopolysaccharide synthesis family protein